MENGDGDRPSQRVQPWLLASGKAHAVNEAAATENTRSKGALSHLTIREVTIPTLLNICKALHGGCEGQPLYPLARSRTDTEDCGAEEGKLVAKESGCLPMEPISTFHLCDHAARFCAECCLRSLVLAAIKPNGTFRGRLVRRCDLCWKPSFRSGAGEGSPHLTHEYVARHLHFKSLASAAASQMRVKSHMKKGRRNYDVTIPMDHLRFLRPVTVGSLRQCVMRSAQIGGLRMPSCAMTNCGGYPGFMAMSADDAEIRALVKWKKGRGKAIATMLRGPHVAGQDGGQHLCDRVQALQTLAALDESSAAGDHATSKDGPTDMIGSVLGAGSVEDVLSLPQYKSSAMHMWATRARALQVRRQDALLDWERYQKRNAAVGRRSKSSSALGVPASAERSVKESKLPGRQTSSSASRRLAHPFVRPRKMSTVPRSGRGARRVPGSLESLDSSLVWFSDRAKCAEDPKESASDARDYSKFLSVYSVHLTSTALSRDRVLQGWRDALVKHCKVMVRNGNRSARMDTCRKMMAQEMDRLLAQRRRCRTILAKAGTKRVDMLKTMVVGQLVRLVGEQSPYLRKCFHACFMNESLVCVGIEYIDCHETLKLQERRGVLAEGAGVSPGCDTLTPSVLDEKASLFRNIVAACVEKCVPGKEVVRRRILCSDVGRKKKHVDGSGDASHSVEESGIKPGTLSTPVCDPSGNESQKLLVTVRSALFDAVALLGDGDSDGSTRDDANRGDDASDDEVPPRTAREVDDAHGRVDADGPLGAAAGPLDNAYGNKRSRGVVLKKTRAMKAKGALLRARAASAKRDGLFGLDPAGQRAT